MSIKVLVAILGQETVDAMTREEIRQLADALDEEILADDALTKRLANIVTEAAKRAQDSRTAG